MLTADDVLNFWFKELTPKQHFLKDEAVDALIRARFLSLYEVLCDDSAEFTIKPRGKLAAIIVFDQFSRQMFRGQAKAFATDRQALMLAKALIDDGDDLAFLSIERSFIYIPFMHSENIEDQHESVRLFKILSDENSLVYAEKHLQVIHCFGRFPHRNRALGRNSTGEELAFINTPGTSF